MAEEALATVEANATEIGVFMELVAEQARTQVERLTGLLADIEQDLATADGMEGLFERLIDGCTRCRRRRGRASTSASSARRGATPAAGSRRCWPTLEAQRAGEPSPGVDEAGIRNAPRLG